LTLETPAKPAPTDTRRSWSETLRDPTFAGIVVYAVLAMGMVVAGYFYIFTTFAAYDDEGTLLVSLQAFAHGEVLYRDVYSPYGPFYYELFGGLFALTGATITNDLSRSLVLVLWVGSSLLYGFSAQRLSGRLEIGAAAMVAAFATLFVLANEPMHPQVLCALLLGGITLLAVSGPGRRPGRLGAAAGALVAALLLTKLNLGVYALAAAVLAAALTWEPLRSRRWLSISVAVLVVAMPAFVVGRDLDEEWARNLVGVEILSLAAIAVVGWTVRDRTREDGLGPWLLGAAAGFVVAFVAIMAAIMLNGSSLADVYDGVVTEAMRVRDVNPNPFLMANAVVDWSIAAFGLALLCARLRPTEPGRAGWVSGAARAFVGLVILFGIAGVIPFSLNPSPGNKIVLPMILAWVAVLPPHGVAESPFKRFLRIFLPALAVAEGLQVYPVAGSQVGIAGLSFVPVGALCLADGLALLRQWSAERGRLELERFGVVAFAVLAVVAVDLSLNVVGRTAVNAAATYRNQPSLPLRGAEYLHLPEDQTQMYASMTAAVEENGCTALIGYPNVNSFYLWTGIEPPPPAAPGVWLLALDSEKQQRIVDELRAAERPCVIRSENRAGLWLGGREVERRPLVRYIFGNFRPALRVGEFEFLAPKPSATEG
jgi:hypothetical protein